ncbi:MAG: ribose 5-phosphate isomerase B [Flavobacteriaceae bacterium]|nr:ribose 5-phosphate isomerase B [Flavobacteriaceae bacterium]|tara:strand:- start:508 stop:939 length:432 start_codon:yes stop_codon:yes gene_type:complete
MTISIGNDHAGVELKNHIVKYLNSRGFTIIDKGTNTDKSVDYPDFIHPVSKEIEEEKSNIGIIICGSGNGAAMTANKRKTIRAALCWNNEITKLARQHNDANILSIPSRFISKDEAIKIVETFINTDFEGGRHQRRIGKIPCQ